MFRSIALALFALLASPFGHADELRYYPLPAGSAPQAVAPGSDGRIWFSAGGLGALGRLDPQTGQSELIPLGPEAHPQDVLVDADGAAWVVDAGLNALVRIDPQRLGVETFKLPPEAAAAELASAVLDNDGNLWFTGRKGLYGRFDPRRKTFQVWPAPDGEGPDGIGVTPAGEIWYANPRGHALVHVDPVDGRAEVLPAAHPGQAPQRLWSDAQGKLWVSAADADELSLYDPLAREWREWPLPDGEQARPYAVYVDEQDRIWLSDLAGDALLRFNPFSHDFTRFASDRPGTAVRQLRGRVGEVWGAESGQDRLVVIRY
ncbi:lyase [Pseudomonas sp. RIT-PI-AD]|uniref:Vgb family protein n=1 Tax=Pseudomonas sp. RIT-PI-AD TaxID=3035294 RepID=UPI0021D8AFCA|nr:lyase [Pseudomonas sp. RIT-PI-AD]